MSDLVIVKMAKMKRFHVSRRCNYIVYISFYDNIFPMIMLQFRRNGYHFRTSNANIYNLSFSFLLQLSINVLDY